MSCLFLERFTYLFINKCMRLNKTKNVINYAFLYQKINSIFCKIYT